MEEVSGLVQTREPATWKGVTTVLHLDRDLNPDWIVGQGDDLERNRATIELNLNRIFDETSDMEEASMYAVSYWIDMYCTLLCGRSSEEATKFLVNAVHKDSELRKTLIGKAKREIKEAEKFVRKDEEEVCESFLEALEEK